MRRVAFQSALVALILDRWRQSGDWLGKLQLSPPATADPSSVRALDEKVDDWFAKSPTAADGVEATFDDIARHVLPSFPQADRRYIWQRVIALKCKLVTGAGALNPSEQMHVVDDLVVKFYSAPPP